MSCAVDISALYDNIHASDMPEELCIALYFHFSLTPVRPLCCCAARTSRLTLEWQRGASRRGWLQPASATTGHTGEE